MLHISSAALLLFYTLFYTFSLSFWQSTGHCQYITCSVVVVVVVVGGGGGGGLHFVLHVQSVVLTEYGSLSVYNLLCCCCCCWWWWWWWWWWWFTLCSTCLVCRFDRVRVIVSI